MYQNIYTDGALNYSAGGEALTAGGIFYGERSALNMSISYGFSLSSIFEAELFTIFVSMNEIVKCKAANKGFKHSCFHILADNAGAINLVNRINNKKYLQRLLFD